MDAFAKGFQFINDNVTATVGAVQSEAWVNDLGTTIDNMSKEMINSMNEIAAKKNLDDGHLQGFIAEIWHTKTYNMNAELHGQIGNAIQPDVNTYASADIRIPSGNSASEFSLKYYQTAKGSLDSQSISPAEKFEEGVRNAERHGRTYSKTLDQYLHDRGIKHDGSENMSMYEGMGKIIPTEQLEEARQRLQDKIEEYGKSSLPDADIQIKRYQEVLNTLSDVVKGSDGQTSIRLSHYDAMRLAKAVNQGEIDKDLLKQCGIDISELITAKDIAQEALTAGLSATAMSMIISIAPAIVNGFSKLAAEGEIDAEELKNCGKSMLNNSARAFIRGSVAAALTACCQTGKFGENLVNVDAIAVSSLVVVSMGTIESAIKCATGKIDKGEMAREIMRLYITAASSYALGTAAAALFDGFPLAYIMGSFIGSIVGGLISTAVENIFISYCIESGCTFFGLVDQNYSIPEDVLTDAGIDSFSFEKMDVEQFEYDRFSVEQFNANNFNYEQFGIRILRRDLIGVNSIGYR